MIALLAWALADDSERDEDAMFGEGESPPATEAPATVGPPAEGDAVLEEGVTRSDAAIAARLAEAAERFAVGGQSYFRVYVPVAAETPAEDTAVSLPALLDVYLDARPNDRLRAYAQGRLSADFALEEGDVDSFGNELQPTGVALDQLWLKGDVARTAFWTFGRQRIKWGSGRFWNPTDFVNQATLDPLATYDLLTGATLARVDVPIQKTGTNVILVGSLEGVSTFEELGGAVRVEQVVGLTELALTAATGPTVPVRLGAELSTALWLFDLRAEAAVRHGDTSTWWEGDLDYDTLTFPTERDRSEDWIPQVVAGFDLPIKIADQNSLTVGAEVFWNDAGYDDAELYPWLAFNGGFTPFYLGRLYGGAYVYLPGAGRLSDHSVTGSWLGNLSDGSHVVRADYRVNVLTRLQLSASVNGHLGEPGEFRLAVDPIPGVLPDGIPAPVVDVQVGALLSF